MAVPHLVLDSNVLASSFTSGKGASRELLRQVLRGECVAAISVPLFLEYEDVLARPQVRQRCALSAREQEQLFDAFLARTELVEVYYRWRPNLRDESDNHVLELAIAAGSIPIITFNRRDFVGGELRTKSRRLKVMMGMLPAAAWLKAHRATGKPKDPS
jgi:putative PIN family toxin of toxin-antitoxin system